MGFPPTCKPFESHGYKQALQLLQGELTPKEAVFYAQRNTRNYAKRQMTWFRKEADMVWFKGFAPAACEAPWPAPPASWAASRTIKKNAPIDAACRPVVRRAARRDDPGSALF